MNIKPIRHFENKYLITDTGKVFSIQMDDWLKLGICSNGYPNVKLHENTDKITGKRTYKTIRVHRLVAMQFIPNPNSAPCVNHIDGVKTNNNLHNLEWCTHKENAEHAFATGLTPKKPKVLSQPQLEECKEQYKRGIPIKALALNYGVTRKAIEPWILSDPDLSEARKMHLSLRSQASGKKTAKVVHQYTKAGVFITEWESYSAAGKALNISAGNIHNAASGRCKSAGGYAWKRP